MSIRWDPRFDLVTNLDPVFRLGVAIHVQARLQRRRTGKGYYADATSSGGIALIVGTITCGEGVAKAWRNPE